MFKEMVGHVVLLFCLAAVSDCQMVENNDNECPGYTINNYIYGTEAYSLQPSTNSGDSPKQGRPGKIGPRGHHGLKGEKGIKGKPGKSDDTALEIQLLKTELSSLKSNLEKYMLPSTCEDINGTETDSGVYRISPDPIRVEPFSVYCNFTGDTSDTIIEHNSMNEIKATKCGAPKCYQRKIRYGNVTIEQIKALILRSSKCRQFIKYRCLSSVIFHRGYTDYAAWVSRDGLDMRYWGGATSQRNDYCACGETDTCVGGSEYKCNCDLEGAGVEFSDQGYLTDRNTLPVSELKFGDTSASDDGWHTLGPLKCNGKLS